jgi:hypothetical protein
MSNHTQIVFVAQCKKKAQANAGHSRSEWSGVFEGPSSSSLGSGPVKTPPARSPGVQELTFSFEPIRAIRG